MRRTETAKKIIDVHELVSVTCNKCGDSHTKDSVDDDYGVERFHEIDVPSFGYGSRYDSEKWSFDLCDDCLTDLIKTFKIIPDGFGEDNYLAAYPQVMFDQWKETGRVNLEAGMTEEEIESYGGSIYGDEVRSRLKDESDREDS